MIELPEWNVIRDKEYYGLDRDALDEFIWEHTPASAEDEKAFREMLAKAIDSQLAALTAERDRLASDLAERNAEHEALRVQRDELATMIKHALRTSKGEPALAKWHAQATEHLTRKKLFAIIRVHGAGNE